MWYDSNMHEEHIIEELKKIGLSDKAAAIYAAVLDLGVAFPSAVAERTHLKRSTVYTLLTDLAIKGLVTELERNKKICYQAERPSKIVSFARGQIQLAEDRLERAKKVLPDLEGIFSLVSYKPRVRYFEGADGVKTVYEDHINENTAYEMVGFSNVEELVKFFSAQFLARYVKTKEKIGVKTRGILPNTAFSRRYNERVYRGLNKKTHMKIRTIPADLFPYKGELTVYGTNKVSIINFHENVLIGVIIEDKMIHDMMRMIFELSWRGADTFTRHT